MSAVSPSDDQAARIGTAMLDLLRRRIEAAGGCLPFDAFMETALYEAGIGYYDNGLLRFDEQGDFVTAPESGGLFARCVARCAVSVLEQIEDASLLELGAGSGRLALHKLLELHRLGFEPAYYHIVERSTAMRAWQRRTLQALPQALRDKVDWLDAPPAAFRGLVLANEVADALPVKRFEWRKGALHELGVAARDGVLEDCSCEPGDALRAHVAASLPTADWPTAYRSEYCPGLEGWVQDLSNSIECGALLLIDYGYGRAEYYHPQRVEGTLMSHYRHSASDAVLRQPGLQDITAFVDFTSVTEAACATGMQLAGFDSQARFLVRCGIDEILASADPQDARRYLALSNEAKRLLLPGDMGDRFKAIAFTRDLHAPLRGFAQPDLRSRL